jgi:two-component system, OmpR family, sensor histidine kinase BaeS
VSTSSELERLAYTVHEVRSPVAALAAVAEALAATHASDDVRKLVELALAACAGIGRVLDDAVLDITRVDGVDVARIAADATAAASLGGARVLLQVAPEVPPLSADPIRVRQALDNLIGNALVHGAAGEAVVRVSMKDGSVHLSVWNGGEGISPEDRTRIFEPGVRLDPNRPGSGLGLAVVRAVAELHGGTITLESTAGQGVTFTMSLPVCTS